MALKTSRQLHGLADAASDLAVEMCWEVLRQGQKLHHLRIGENGGEGGTDQQHQADQKAPPRFEPRFVPEHVQSSAATVSRKISFKVTGMTSMDTGRSALASSTIASAPPLDITVSIRPLRCIRTTPGAWNCACGASPSKTIWMR